MIQTTPKAVMGMATLAAAFWGTPFGARTCTGPNCRNGQCTQPATVVVSRAPVFERAPQIYTATSEEWVWVDLPVSRAEVTRETLTTDPAEYLRSPTEDVIKAEVDDQDEAQSHAKEPTEESEAAGEGPQDRETKVQAARSGDAAATKKGATTERVRMRAVDAAAIGLIPQPPAGTGFGSVGSSTATTVACPVAYRTVTYSCWGSGQSTVQYRVQQQQYWGTSCRGPLFPNLFPRLRGLR